MVTATSEDYRKYLTVRQVAEALNLSLPTAYRLVKSGRIRAVNVGLGKIPRYRICREALDGLLRGDL